MTPNTNNTDLSDYIDDEIVEALADECFMPIEMADELADTELGLTARDLKVLEYFAGRGTICFRLEPKGAAGWATLARWSDDGIELHEIDRNGVTNGEIRFPYSTRGLTWLKAVIAS